MENKWTKFIYGGGQVPTLELPEIKTPILIDMKQIEQECYWQGNNLIHVDSCHCDDDYEQWIAND